MQIKLPQSPEPYWRASVKLPQFPVLDQDINVDVAIVGGGITGITTAYLLANEGLSIAVLDAGELFNGTTGHTTAKITAQHDLIYDELITQLGSEKAKKYYSANHDALQWIKSTISIQKIDCDFSNEAAYLFTESDSDVKKLENEMRAYEQLGIDGVFLQKIPLSINVKAALMMEQQGQFHPLKYLKRLLGVIVEKGGRLYENTKALDIEKGKKQKISTENGCHIFCDKVVICSHHPFYDGAGFYFSRMYAERSYVLAVKSEQPYPGGMYLSVEDPKRSIRHTPIGDDHYLIIGGENHKTGQGVETSEHYEALKKFVKTRFDVDSIAYRWSAQDLTTLDNIPYIGEISAGNPHILVATGYRKWGMTSSAAAGLLLKDLILEKENPYKELYTPSRFHPNPSIKTFVQQNADVAKHLVKGKLESPSKTAADLERDEGAVILFNGKRAGAYKDEDGTVHMVDTTCTHMRCEVEWNSGERTWDCPCHGSRFSITGEVLEGPAEKPLDIIK
ncbi:FAD-dependent oxidoreductase [Bacillus chungangensis]|uniref:Glycine/D-amino acid oxidase-like deaminating enzyme/nitrite reductase/ring-hydroxylating ferredoxin subunit n=1 Tax=Bacillus chungangensis TaxID=587633 RepID=A0ABT9WVU4_9BACI|nr:FAD-dependent oxidoreductase [Bacillus chungangensis]MDQ0177430.1 glycine/D-amino acid oxidase-like deaminating enzyme/nitrite reductase/ring-hydroxylating ferredoxin subunit [Bacillus chungangensis]